MSRRRRSNHRYSPGQKSFLAYTSFGFLLANILAAAFLLSISRNTFAVVGSVLSLLGLIIAGVALRKIRRSYSVLRGENFAWMGLVGNGCIFLLCLGIFAMWTFYLLRGL